MKRILVGYDGSQEAKDAVVFATDLAKATSAELLVATIADVQAGLSAPELQTRLAEFERQQAFRAEELAREAVNVAVERGAKNVDLVVQTGPAAEGLADLARERDAGLVVIGHRGRGAIARMLMGSVADRLVQIAPRPVLVVR